MSTYKIQTGKVQWKFVRREPVTKVVISSMDQSRRMQRAMEAPVVSQGPNIRIKVSGYWPLQSLGYQLM